jgi:hypothetical protein
MESRDAENFVVFEKPPVTAGMTIKKSALSLDVKVLYSGFVFIAKSGK